MGWGMMSEYLLGDDFEGGGDGGYSSNGGPGSGCLVIFVFIGAITVAAAFLVLYCASEKKRNERCFVRSVAQFKTSRIHEVGESEVV